MHMLKVNLANKLRRTIRGFEVVKNKKTYKWLNLVAKFVLCFFRSKLQETPGLKNFKVTLTISAVLHTKLALLFPNPNQLALQIFFRS